MSVRWRNWRMPVSSASGDTVTITRTSLISGILGVARQLCAFFLDRDRALQAYLFGYLTWTGLALGCLGVLLLHHTVGGQWGLAIRRPCEAGARTIPFLGVLFLPIFLGSHSL